MKKSLITLMFLGSFIYGQGENKNSLYMENYINTVIVGTSEKLEFYDTIITYPKIYSVVRDEKQIGGFEIQATNVEIISIAEEYPISNKEHGPDFLMDHRHLWLRSRRQWAIMRVRNRIIFAIHSFFQAKGFVQMDAPIFTGNACEGTSNLFETDYYGDPAYLSQSGQLYGEAMAMAMGKIYTFGPTFRAEKSKTRRHLSEFWMLEPEMAFYDIFDNMDLIEQFLHHVLKDVLESCKEELKIIGRETDLLESS